MGGDIDTAFDALADPHRRLALDVLRRQAPETVSEETLATRLERVREEGDLALGREGDVTTGLYHVHLPKLDEAGFVDWNRTRETVSYNPDEFVERCLDLVRSQRESDPVERVLSGNSPDG